MLRDNQDRNRIASLADVPERLGHCLTYMFPSTVGHFDPPRSMRSLIQRAAERSLRLREAEQAPACCGLPVTTQRRPASLHRPRVRVGEECWIASDERA